MSNVPTGDNGHTSADVDPTLPCPAWCDTDHAKHDWSSEYVSDDGFVVYRERHHEHDVARIDNPSRGPDAQTYVGVSVTDDLDEGRRMDYPAVNVDGAELMTPDMARQVAAALIEAADLLENTK